MKKNFKRILSAALALVLLFTVFPAAFAQNNINAKIKKGVPSRFVTHYGVTREDLDLVLSVIKDVLKSA